MNEDGTQVRPVRHRQARGTLEGALRRDDSRSTEDALKRIAVECALRDTGSTTPHPIACSERARSATEVFRIAGPDGRILHAEVTVASSPLPARSTSMLERVATIADWRRVGLSRL